MDKAISRSICFTKFLMEKDCLSAAMTRLGNGFTPPSAVAEARYHLTRVTDLVSQMEDLARLPLNPKKPLEKSCCGRGD